jgi:hypothetical protein
MSVHGPAQLELIRRYARTLRTMHADAMAVRVASPADRAGRIVRDRRPSEPSRAAAAARSAPDRAQPTS